jgi:hypothetical protein
MLATLGGILALLAGLAVLLIPLLLPELSRPRDAFWGALVLLLGLVLVTSAERLSGAPMLAVLCGGLLIGRLGSEVGLGRWRQLSGEEQQRFWAPERWQTSLQQLGASLNWLQQRLAVKPKPATTKRWVRPEAPDQQEEKQAQPPLAPVAAEVAAIDAPPVVEVRSFEEIDLLVQRTLATEPPAEPAAPGEAADTSSLAGPESPAP